MKPSIKILTSAIGYGTYFPALLVKKKLESLGFEAELFIFERLYSPEKKKLFYESAEAFATNFKLAQLANKVPVDYQASTNIAEIQTLYDRWSEDASIHFLCFSGLWFKILKNFASATTTIKISCCRMDAGNAHTWINHANLEIDEVYYMFDVASRSVNYRFEIPSFFCLPYNERKNDVVIHGGGWGLGDFIKSTSGLVLKGYHRNIIIRNNDDYNSKEIDATFFMNDPHWDILFNDNHGESFPSFGKIIEGEIIDYVDNDKYHPILDLVNTSKAIISKPGGMTLADSLISCTPLFYLEPLGENEIGNSIVIDMLKIGMSFKKWEKKGFDPRYLTLFHKNLKNLKRKIPDFVLTYLEANEYKTL